MRQHLIWLSCTSFLMAFPAFGEDAPVTPLAEISADKPVEQKSVPSVDAPTAGSVVTLDVAIQKALANSPRLKASTAAIAASKGEQRQADALINPEASVGAENIGGDRQYQDISPRQLTYGVSQKIEVGGKRGARSNMADQGVMLASFDYEAARLDIIRDVQLAYADAIAAQEQVKITAEQENLAKEVLSVVNQRVGAAREPLIQKSKAQVTLSSSTIAHDKAERALVTAKRNLAALWGNAEENYPLDDSAFYTITEPKPIIGAENWKQNPDFKRFDTEIARNRAALDLEKANAVPDPTVNAGVRTVEGAKGQAFVVGLSLPIPVFNLNRGNIEKASQEVNRTESEKNVAALKLNTELTRAQAELETAYHQASELKKTILPAADKAFKLSRQGYGEGKFSYLEVLDAQRTLYETRSNYQDALRDYHRNRAEVERLTATHLAPTNHSEESHE